jgi:hypothetical protein
MADVLRLDVPPETPSTLRRTGGIVIGIAAILGALRLFTDSADP